MNEKGKIPRRVLVVEDVALIAMALSMMLLDLGAEDVMTATNVAQGLSALRNQRFDLALVDIQLGDDNGLVVAERCAQLGIPVIYSSGHGDMMVPVAYKGEAVLTKLYTVTQLETAIRRIMA